MKKKTIRAWAIIDEHGVCWTREANVGLRVPGIYRSEDDAYEAMPSDLDMQLCQVNMWVEQVRVTIEPIKTKKGGRTK